MNYTYSLIVCCYNSSRVIDATIQAICELDTDDDSTMELIVVDNNCTDTTIEQVRVACSSRQFDLMVLSEATPGLMNARRTGVAAARNDIVVFIDDDNVVSKSWLRILDDVYTSNINVGCVGGEVLPADNNAYPWWFHEYQGVYACGKQAETSMIVSCTRMTLFGAGLTFRREVILSIFSAASPLYLTGRTMEKLLRGDDSELCMKCLLIGYDVFYCDKLVLTHNILPERVTWAYVKSARYGGGMADMVLALYRSVNAGKSPKSYLGTVLSIIKRWVDFIKNPANIINMHKEGMLASFEYQYIKGMTAGLFLFPPRRYNEIRNNLLRAVSSRNVSK